MCTMFFSEITSFIAALLFAVHPIHVEAVSIAVVDDVVLSISFSVYLLLKRILAPVR